jgi:hypothetical protein
VLALSLPGQGSGALALDLEHPSVAQAKDLLSLTGEEGRDHDSVIMCP